MADQPAPDPVPQTEEPYQSLYRRFRPQRFADVRGQQHVTRALSNAVRDGRVAHAYLFSGPRGTGKTSTARILAMALNCEHPVDGEPDGVCLSCVEIRRGASMDVQELDAASNRGLDEMRDLLSRVALGVRGRWKVYIIDEVHQLTPNAASALLKTLEEPPAHVVFVLATTDPQKVLPTIRSRTQHFEFHLLGSDVLGELLHSVNERAGLGVAPEAIDLVVRRGHGSARDALTVLDQVAASASDVEDVATVVSDIVNGLAERDPGQVLLAVAEGMSAGRDARRLAADIVEHLRNGFMATMARSLVMLPDDALAEVEEQARRIGPAALVRAMDGIGQALTDMRDSVDPRVTLEVALVRLARPDLDTSTGALLERIERLERAVGVGGRDAGDLRGRGGRGGGPQPEPRGSEDSPASAGGLPPVARAAAAVDDGTPATGLDRGGVPAAGGGAGGAGAARPPAGEPGTQGPAGGAVAPVGAGASRAGAQVSTGRPSATGDPSGGAPTGGRDPGPPPPVPRRDRPAPPPADPLSTKPALGAVRGGQSRGGPAGRPGAAGSPSGEAVYGAGPPLQAAAGTGPGDAASGSGLPLPPGDAAASAASRGAAGPAVAGSIPEVGRSGGAGSGGGVGRPGGAGSGGAVGRPGAPGPGHDGAGPGAPAPAPGPDVARSATPAGPGGTAPAGPGAGAPSRDELTKAWGDGVLRRLSGRAKAYLGSGRFLEVDERGAVFAVPDKHLMSRAESVRPEAEAALAAHFGRPISLRLVLDPGAKPIEQSQPLDRPDDPSLEDYDVSELEDAPPAVASPEQRLLDAFPGAEEVST